MWSVVYLPAAEQERAALHNAVVKLEQLGPALGYPHSSAIRGAEGLRELRPRRGRSPWRGLYRQIGEVFVIAAIGPEAEHDSRGFRWSCEAAVERLDELEEEWTMVKLSELQAEAEIHEQDLRDEEYRLEVERTRFANDVAIKVIQYRVAHGLSQAELARRLGMRQPNVARLESGEHEPSLSTLARLSLALGLNFSVEVKTGALRLRYPASREAGPGTRVRRGRKHAPVSQTIKEHNQAAAASRQGA